jgi:hypothetical protein
MHNEPLKGVNVSNYFEGLPALLIAVVRTGAHRTRTPDDEDHLAGVAMTPSNAKKPTNGGPFIHDD